jgi:hypothetical protein
VPAAVGSVQTAPEHRGVGADVDGCTGCVEAAAEDKAAGGGSEAGEDGPTDG